MLSNDRENSEMKQFRPRLIESEVKFLLEMLEGYKANAEKKLQEREQLKIEIWQLRKLLIVSPYDALKQGWREKKERLAELEARQYQVWHYIRIYEGLCIRFQELLDGKKRGRLPSKVDLGRMFLEMEIR